MRVVVDVMGGDHGCEVVVGGAQLALRTNARLTDLFLVGQQPAIERAVANCCCHDPRLHIVHAADVLTMEDKPVVALRHKKDCSIARAMDLLKEGRAEALVSPGNTGGVVAAATIKLRPLPGVERPAIATVIPTPDHEFVLLDAGANIDCKPIHLAQFAIMGSVYAHLILGQAHPRVGLLSIGTEASKGNDLTLEAYKLCQQVHGLNFIGHVEGHDLFANRVDVVVCDGFVGNVVLKTCEGLATGIFSWLKREARRNPLRLLGAWLARGGLRSIKRRLDPEVRGGAPLLGLNGNVLIAHGSSSERAIMGAIHLATEALQNHINQTLTQEIAAAKTWLGRQTVPASVLT